MNFLTQDHLGYYRGGAPVVEYYNQKIRERREKYPFTINEKYLPMVEEMNQNGFCIMKDFFDKDILTNLLIESDALFLSNSEKTKQVQNGSHTIVTEPFLNTSNGQVLLLGMFDFCENLVGSYKIMYEAIATSTEMNPNENHIVRQASLPTAAIKKGNMIPGTVKANPVPEEAIPAARPLSFALNQDDSSPITGEIDPPVPMPIAIIAKAVTA